MRKFILYFLLVLLFAAVVTFSYGLLNGEKIRGFAAQISAIQARHDLASQIEKIEANFHDNGKKEISQIRDESKHFLAELETIIQEAESAKKEIENLNAPKKAENTKKLTEDYYSKLVREAVDLKGIFNYMNQIIDAAAVFGEIKENISLDELKNLIAEAKEKGNAVETDSLPLSLRTNAQNLKNSMNSFLLEMEDMANLKLENAKDLDASYIDFSKKEDEFFGSAKKYIDEMEDLSVIEDKINLEIERLEKMKFSIR